MPRRQYESFFVVVKLSVVVRRASRRSKALIKVHLIHAQHFKIKVTRQVKVRSKVTMKSFTFWALGSVRRSGKRSNSPKVLDRYPERILLKYEEYIYKRSKSGHKRSL